MSTTVTIKPSELSSYLMAEGVKVKNSGRKAAIAGARKFRALLVKRTDELGVTDRGQLKNSWKAEKTEDGAIVFTDCPYAGIIELGARPHPVSVEGQAAIAEWAVRKLGVDPKEAKSVAFLISRKIAREGQKPKYLVQGVIGKATQYYREELERILKAAVATPGKYGDE